MDRNAEWMAHFTFQPGIATATIMQVHVGLAGLTTDLLAEVSVPVMPARYGIQGWADIVSRLRGRLHDEGFELGEVIEGQDWAFVAPLQLT